MGDEGALNAPFHGVGNTFRKTSRRRISQFWVQVRAR
jgi:hypothetical protein